MKKHLPETLFLLLLSAIVYLPHIGNLTYYTDDWYYIYDGMAGGVKIFHEMFRIDRPARGYFFEWYFSLLGNHPLPWHIGIYLWRGAAALGALWIFNILWKNARKFNFTAALLFIIFPGYFWWISAIEYQPMMASLALQTLSIALTLKAVQTQRLGLRIALLASAVLTGWLYIALVDYAIGMEAFRFFALYLLAGRGVSLTMWKRLWATIRLWAWNALIPLGFVIYRIFFFTNERKATDIGTQLGVFVESPLAALMAWFFQLYRSLFSLTFDAWFNQFTIFFQNLRLRDMAGGLLTAAAVVGLVLLSERWIKASDEEKDIDGSQVQAQQEALLLGSLGMVFGILPTVLANRYINTVGYSHYGLPVSLAAALFIAAFVGTLSQKRTQTVVLNILVVFAVLAHFGIATQAKRDEAALKEFWWQVAWRVPALREGTTLVVQYPIAGMEGDGFGLMEAANVLYFPVQQSLVPVVYPISGLTPNSEHLPAIVDGTGEWVRTYRSHTSIFNYSNTLVLSQPTTGSCVHVLDGTQPLISIHDPVGIVLSAPSSNIDGVILDAEPTVPQEYIFGAEPERDWCYYFQKAELAAQMGNWDEVAALGEETFRLAYSPEDRVEWLPFLKAYAMTGNAERLEQLSKRVIGEKMIRSQICEMFGTIEQPLDESVRNVIDGSYCKGEN
ncbi:MAG: hypothetical protein H6635_11320 [Anaerolineales bacterium]|nr:hypothetical protein [Anaerolineales bacterium]